MAGPSISPFVGQAPSTARAAFPSTARPPERTLIAIAGLSPWATAIVLASTGLALALLVHLAVRAYGRHVADRTRHGIDDILAAKLALPAALAVAFAGLVFAAGAVATRAETLLLLERALPSGLVVIGAIALTRVLLALARTHGGHRHHRAIILFGRFAGFFIAVFVGLTLLSIWDVEITPLLASAGIVGIALALAAQETLGNIFAGIAIYLDRTYLPGDYVILDRGERDSIRGEIFDIGLRSTRIRTRDDMIVVIPNSDIGNARIINESARPFHRIRTSLIVAHDSDLDQVEEALIAGATDCGIVLDAPAPYVRFREITPEGVRVVLFAWIDDAGLRGQAVHTVIKSIHRSLAAMGVRYGAPMMVRYAGQEH